MPIFEYRCKKCDTLFEVIILPIQSNPEPICPRCKGRGDDVSKEISTPNIRMEGRAGLRTVPDYEPPLQRLKRNGPRKDCDGGYKDIPELSMDKMIRTKDKDGNTVYREKERTTFSN